jgi:crotonobetainyl-CoA:carnitine CoA-transferase CaiB-like acyl-CoA transferase
MPEPVLPLAGITVVSLEQAVAAPLTTRHLADLGARVIKVERPGTGDFARGYDRSVHGEASYFVWLNRGKESVELDLKDPEDRSLLQRMVATADVFVQNLVPGAVARLGLDAATLRRDRPELIHISISGYGSAGPYRDKKAYDALIQAETGLIAATGSRDEPARVGISVADIATGVYAYTGALTALYQRERTGTGATLEVAMIDALGEWMSQPAYYAAYGDAPWHRSGARHATIAPYGPFRCGDGHDVFLSVQNDREWAVLCADVLADPALVTDERFVHNPERLANEPALRAIIETVFRRDSADGIALELERAGIANGRMRAPADLFQHPQLEARGRWRDVEAPGGSVKALLPPVVMEGIEPVMGAVPRLGAHTAALRREFATPRPESQTESR